MLLLECLLDLIRFLLGAALFSFMNVVAWRLPRGMDPLQGRSHCEDDLEEKRHGQEEDQGAQNRVEQHRIKPAGTAVHRGRLVVGAAQHRGDPTGHALRLGGRRHGWRSPGFRLD